MDDLGHAESRDKLAFIQNKVKVISSELSCKLAAGKASQLTSSLRPLKGVREVPPAPASARTRKPRMDHFPDEPSPKPRGEAASPLKSLIMAHPHAPPCIYGAPPSPNASPTSALCASPTSCSIGAQAPRPNIQLSKPFFGHHNPRTLLHLWLPPTKRTGPKRWTSLH
jgi:hypothetical protein